MCLISDASSERPSSTVRADSVVESALTFTRMFGLMDGEKNRQDCRTAAPTGPCAQSDLLTRPPSIEVYEHQPGSRQLHWCSHCTPHSITLGMRVTLIPLRRAEAGNGSRKHARVESLHEASVAPQGIL